ncbi:MAG: hypothetical protein HYV09_03880 [Deltaproteobacteria bacterium]|nr:hypothetical protein [Deltaproteobacteria bacterium]
MNESSFGKRMTGEGPRWEAIRMPFEAHRRRLGLDGFDPDARDAPGACATEATTFRRPSAQALLFE